MDKILLDIKTGLLSGKQVISSSKRLGDLKGVFQDEQIRAAMAQDTLVYTVQAWMPESEGAPGGLFFGNSSIMPGRVGKEYFMTRGHFHARRDTAEYYWCMQGAGALILMDEKRHVWFEKMFPGSLHYISGNVAHRAANTGSDILRFNACWYSDAGHDYGTIEKEGFPAVLTEQGGQPVLKGKNDRFL